MLFKFKKLCFCILASVLFALVLPFITGVSAKVRGDCIFSVGPACRPAQWLRKTHKRFQAAPFDWMMKYSLDTVLHCSKNKYADFFENIRSTGQNIGEHRVVVDTKNNIVSMHHFYKNASAEDGKWGFREKMLRRGKRVDEILKNSRSIVLISNRQKDSLDDFKRFIHGFSKLYPERNITLLNVKSNGSGYVTKDLLYEGLAATSAKKSEKIKKNDKNKKQIQNKNKRKKLKIVQYSFNDDSFGWEGNPSGWNQVMNDIELTDRNFDKNMDFRQVEF